MNTESFLWKMYNLFPTFDETSWQFKMIDGFIIVLYDRVNILENVNEARQEMFYEKIWNPENIPPTQFTLHLHVMKAFLLVRQKMDVAKIKTILLMMSMRYLKILEDCLLHRYLYFMTSQELKTPLHLIKKPGYLHEKRQNVFL